MPFVNRVADRLADQMIGDAESREAMIGEHLPPLVAVLFGCGGLFYVKMITPTGKFQPVKAHLFGEGCEFGKGQVGPLAGKKGYRSGHT